MGWKFDLKRPKLLIQVRPNPFDYAEGEALLEKPATLHVRMQDEAKAVFERVGLPSDVVPARAHYLFRS